MEDCFHSYGFRFLEQTFLDLARRHYEKVQMEQIMRNLTLAFFSSSDMALIYPNLFRLLWCSFLPYIIQII